MTYDPLAGDPPPPPRGCATLLVACVLALGVVAWMLALGVGR